MASEVTRCNALWVLCRVLFMWVLSMCPIQVNLDTIITAVETVCPEIARLVLSEAVTNHMSVMPLNGHT